MTVGELLTRMSGAEFSEWIAFYCLEPWGDWRDDFRAGLIAATLCNVNKAKETKAFSALDFMPLIKTEKRESASIEELHRKMRTWLPPRAKQTDQAGIEPA